MDDRCLAMANPFPGTGLPRRPLPVVITRDSHAEPVAGAPQSFTIPLREPPGAPSWQELLGQR